MSNLIILGVDVGQKSEPTGIAVVEIDERQEGRRGTVNHYLVHFLERLPAGTSFPAMAHRLSEISSGISRKSGQTPYPYINVTGLGQPIIDLLWEETQDIHYIKPVYFNHGDQRREEDGKIYLGKAHLVSRLQVLLQSGRLHLPSSPEAERLAQELRDYEIEVREDANDRNGAFQVGTLDDLVTALGLAVDKEPQRIQVF